MTPEQLFQIQQALITPGFFHGEADGEFGPLTRAAIRRYQEAKGVPQNDFLSNLQRQALLQGGTVRSAVDASDAGANSPLLLGTPQSSPPQQPAPAQIVEGPPSAGAPSQETVLQSSLPAARPTQPIGAKPKPALGPAPAAQPFGQVPPSQLRAEDFPQQPAPSYCKMYFCPGLPDTKFEHTKRVVGAVIEPNPATYACAVLDDARRAAVIYGYYGVAKGDAFIHGTPGCGFFYRGTELVIQDEVSSIVEDRPTFMCVEPKPTLEAAQHDLPSGKCYWAILSYLQWRVMNGTFGLPP